MPVLTTSQLAISNIDTANNQVFFTYLGTDGVTYNLHVAAADISSLTNLKAQMAAIITVKEAEITAAATLASGVASAVGSVLTYSSGSIA